MQLSRRKILLLPLDLIVAGEFLKAAGLQSQASYSLLFVDEVYTRDKYGGLIRLNDGSPDPDAVVEPKLLAGNAGSVKRQYEQLRQNGRIPNLNHLDNALEEIAERLSNDELYLSKEFIIRNSYRSNDQLIVDAEKEKMIKGVPYKVLINASGKIEGGMVKLNHLIQYLIQTGDAMESRQIQDNFERWCIPVKVGDMSAQRRTILYQDNVPEIPDFTGIRKKILDGLRYQQIRVGDLR